MAAFKAGALRVIVSTTVIEVGVHVDNATLMIIENADRFGLSQLHQLRGRVGRGKFQSYCVLVTDVKNEQTQKRMKAMTATNDGFKLSELDLEQRGAGDFFGTRQHGLPAFTIANLYRDLDILQEAQNAASGYARGEFDVSETERAHFRIRIDNVLDTATNVGVL
jgi:ATP-dependent DNA helicase RecG